MGMLMHHTWLDQQKKAEKPVEKPIEKAEEAPETVRGAGQETGQQPAAGEVKAETELIGLGFCFMYHKNHI